MSTHTATRSKSLFQPFTLGSLELPNRVVMAPMTRSRALGNVPTDLMAEYYAQRAGAGLIITEGTSPSPNGLGYPRIPGIFSDEQEEGWRGVTEAVHAAGGRIFVQLMHTGRVSHPANLPDGGEVLAPSAVPLEETRMWVDAAMAEEPIPTARAMSGAEVEAAVQEFVEAARRARAAGFDGVELHDPLEMLEWLNEAGGRHGIGRIDIVENRFVGIKSRGVYETPGGTILHHALRDLEGIAMDREVLRLRDMLAPRFAEVIYNGFWFSPEMDFIQAAYRQSERLIDGAVRVRLFKGNTVILGRSSHSSLYDQELSSMDVAGGYDQEDARGFIRINALRLRAHKLILGKTGEDEE